MPKEFSARRDTRGRRIIRRRAQLGALIFASAAAFWAPTAAMSAPTEPACTWFASPKGKFANTGRTADSPLPLQGVMPKPVAGDVVCFEAGTYMTDDTLYLTHTGTASAPVVYRNFGGAATFKRSRGGTTLQMFRIPTGSRFIEIHGLTIDGSNISQNGVLCADTDHVKVIGTKVKNTGAGGIVAVGCDYLTFDRNVVWHAGYGNGFSSAISINSAVKADHAAGFHSTITNNIAGGIDDASAKQTDGNGIIIDLGGASAPPVLVANNLVYMSFGRCVHSFKTAHVWYVNNTCYKNGLREPGTPFGTGEVNFTTCSGCFAINNAVSAWTFVSPFRAESSTVTYSHNTYFGGKPNIVPAGVAGDPQQLRKADPQFANPPAVDPTAPGQWVNAPKGWTLRNRFALHAGSPLIDAGIDPRKLAALTPDLRKVFDAFMSQDLAGRPRVQGAGWDIGAYEQ